MPYSNYYRYSNLYSVNGVFFTDPEILLAWVCDKRNAEMLMGYRLDDCTITVQNPDTFLADESIVLVFTPTDENEDDDHGYIGFTFHADAVVTAVKHW